jgi:hypothetical protein
MHVKGSPTGRQLYAYPEASACLLAARPTRRWGRGVEEILREAEAGIRVRNH